MHRNQIVCPHGVTPRRNCKKCASEASARSYAKRKVSSIQPCEHGNPRKSECRLCINSASQARRFPITAEVPPPGKHAKKCPHGKYWSQRCKECDAIPAYRIMRHGK